MLILPTAVSNATSRIYELVDALTDKTSPCCNDLFDHGCSVFSALGYIVYRILAECRE